MKTPSLPPLWLYSRDTKSIAFGETRCLISLSADLLQCLGSWGFHFLDSDIKCCRADGQQRRTGPQLKILINQRQAKTIIMVKHKEWSDAGDWVTKNSIFKVTNCRQCKPQCNIYLWFPNWDILRFCSKLLGTPQDIVHSWGRHSHICSTTCKLLWLSCVDLTA